MKELKELVELADDAIASGEYLVKVKAAHILETAEAFSALEQRAEAAEAKLAELEKQEPAGKQYRVSAKGNNSVTGWSLWHDGDGEQYRNSYDVEVREVFTRPAPAINIAELVPDEALRELDGIIDWIKCLPIPTNSATKWLIKMSDLRAAILRNIEDKSK